MCLRRFWPSRREARLNRTGKWIGSNRGGVRAETPGNDHHQAHRRRLVGRGPRCRLLGPGSTGLRHQGLSLGPEEIRGPEPGSWRLAAGDARTPRRDFRRAGAARRGAAEAIDRIKRGEDPLPPAPEPERTMADIAKLYMRDYVPAHCKASSAEVSRPWDRARSSVRLPPCLRRRSAAPPARPEEREPIIGHLLGHRRIDTISRCAHLALDTWIIGLQSRLYYSRAN